MRSIAQIMMPSLSLALAYDFAFAWYSNAYQPEVTALPSLLIYALWYIILATQCHSCAQLGCGCRDRKASLRHSRMAWHCFLKPNQLLWSPCQLPCSNVGSLESLQHAATLTMQCFTVSSHRQSEEQCLAPQRHLSCNDLVCIAGIKVCVCKHPQAGRPVEWTPPGMWSCCVTVAFIPVTVRGQVAQWKSSIEFVWGAEDVSESIIAALNQSHGVIGSKDT